MCSKKKGKSDCAAVCMTTNAQAPVHADDRQPLLCFVNFFSRETTEKTDPLSFHQTVSVHVV